MPFTDRFISDLKVKLSHDEVQQVINLIISIQVFLENDLQNEIILISSQYQDLQKTIRKGVLNYSEIVQNSNRIKSNLLSYINVLSVSVDKKNSEALEDFLSNKSSNTIISNKREITIREEYGLHINDTRLLQKRSNSELKIQQEGEIFTMKICIIGASAVGKTSLTQRFVHQKFSASYLTTIGVKVDEKMIEIGPHTVKLMIWDIAGEDDFHKISQLNFIGSHGFFIVSDVTRQKTYLEIAPTIHAGINQLSSKENTIHVFNKIDLIPHNEQTGIKKFISSNYSPIGPTIFTSAKTGEFVENAFFTLAKNILNQHIK